MPGHSAGSIAIHVPLVDAVFVGDGLTTRHVTTGVTGPQPAPFTDEPARALESLDVLPTHERHLGAARPRSPLERRGRGGGGRGAAVGRHVEPVTTKRNIHPLPNPDQSA